jgi:hypothetical protein
MPLADRLAALLVEEATALRHGDAEAVLFLAQQKNELMSALMDDPPPPERIEKLLEMNRNNGMLARSGLALLNQVLGSPSAYGSDRISRAGSILSESV